MANLEITLDSLFREATSAAKRLAKIPKRVEVPLETPLTTWTREENWQHKRYLLLIKEDTQEVLGIFSERFHTKQEGCRKLVRVEGVKAEATEYVGGSWNVPQALEESQHHHVTATLPLTLVKLNEVSAIRVPVDLHFAYGRLANVKLIEATTFACGDNIYTLPARVDVFPVLSQASITTAQEYFHAN